MGKKRKSGGRRKGIKITPKRLIKAAFVIDGALNAGPLVKEVGYIVSHAGQISKEGSASLVQHGKQVLGAAIRPAGEILVAPKVVDKVAAVLSKGEPMIGRLANAKLLTV